MSELFKIVIKPIKQKTQELDPAKIEALKAKRKLQRELKKNKPKQDGIESETKPKIKVNTEEIENINKTLKNLIGFNVSEINDKLQASKTIPIQVGPPPVEVIEVKKKKQIKKKV